jgi:hypothetical protein
VERKTYNRENKESQKLLLFQKNNKIDKSLVRLIKTKREKYKLPISGMKSNVTTHPQGTEMIIQMIMFYMSAQ